MFGFHWFHWALNYREAVYTKGKEIKKNDSSFEKHDRFLAAVQTSFLMNMFDNYQEKHSEKLANVNSTEGVVNYVKKMLEFYDIQLFFDPAKQESDPGVGEDDLFHYCQVREG